MTTPMDDTLTAIGRQLSVTYFPTVLEPLWWDARHTEPSSRAGDTLTGREREVLAIISQGFSNKRIARTLAISPETVKSHVKRIFLKLAVSTRTQAVLR